MRKYAIALGITLLAAAALPAQGGGNKLNSYLGSLPKEPLSQVEKVHLSQIRQEEKLARDVYRVLHWVWKTPIFDSIARSEQSHMDMVKFILDRYNLPDPAANNTIGVYTDQVYSDYFFLLVIFGVQSLDNALTVGAFIEDLDIYDLDHFLKAADNRDIRTVYQNLQKGSRNHLRSFHSQLEARNVTYTPYLLDPQTYQAIVTSPREGQGFVDENGNPI